MDISCRHEGFCCYCCLEQKCLPLKNHNSFRHIFTSFAYLLVCPSCFLKCLLGKTVTFTLVSMCYWVEVGLVYVGTHRISLVALVVAGVPARLYNSTGAHCGRVLALPSEYSTAMPWMSSNRLCSGGWRDMERPPPFCSLHRPCWFPVVQVAVVVLSCSQLHFTFSSFFTSLLGDWWSIFKPPKKEVQLCFTLPEMKTNAHRQQMRFWNKQCLWEAPQRSTS